MPRRRRGRMPGVHDLPQRLWLRRWPGVMMTAHFLGAGWSLVGDPVQQWREGWLRAFSFISIFFFFLLFLGGRGWVVKVVSCRWPSRTMEGGMVGGFLLYFNLLFKKDKIDGVVGVLFSVFFFFLMYIVGLVVWTMFVWVCLKHMPRKL